MSEKLTRSIRAGVRLQELQAAVESIVPLQPSPVANGSMSPPLAGGVPPQSAYAATGSSSGLPPPPATRYRDSTVADNGRPWYRRHGRRVLQSLRPLAWPILNRFDHRVRWAVDRSNTAEALRGALVRLDGIAEALGPVMARDRTRQQAAFDDIHALIVQVTERIDDLDSKVMGTNGSLSAMQLAIDRVASQLGAAEAGLQKMAALNGSLLRRHVIPLGSDLAVRTEAGYLLVPSEDLGLLVTVLETEGRLEPGTLSVVLSLLPEGGAFVDVGANIGTFTLPASRRVGPGGSVLAIEPAPRLAALLRRTLALNFQSDTVQVHNCAAGAVDTVRHFALSAQVTHNSFLSVADTVQTIDVRVHRLDDLVPRGQHVHVVKIDVEGGELDVWRGMQRIVAENPDMAIVLEFAPEHIRNGNVSVTDWLQEVASAGHTAWEIDEGNRMVRPLRERGLEEVYSLNILLIRHPPRSLGLHVA